jgi:hypothetical protein
MKKYIAILAGTILGFISCNDNFMEQVPQTQLTVAGYFKSTNDLQVYVQGLYQDEALYQGGKYDDNESDNITYNNGGEVFRWLLTDQRTPQNASGWDGWSSLRSINVMLANLDDVTGTEADINNYVGIARYFRAWFYFNKIIYYSDVPWIDRPLETDDPLLYETQTPRAEVVAHVMEDLEYASANIKGAAGDLGDKTHVNQYAALALLSRFALYEGTYRKYHPELNLASTANEFLEKTVWACEQIMNSGLFDISGTGITPLGDIGYGSMTGAEGFRNLFVQPDLSGNKEVILWRRYDVDKTFGSWNQSDGTSNALSRSLQESFLTKEGKPYSTVAGHDTKTWFEVFVDRDPRFCETFSGPGVYDSIGDQRFYRTYSPTRGGFSQVKYFSRDASRAMKGNRDGLGQYNGLLHYRYGEILLNYAEAKAELGQWSADVADKTVNKLRDRVLMPHFDAEREYDDILQSLYPNITDKILLALRRERRVELACEGHRLLDIFRWGAGKTYELNISKQGMYVPYLPYVYDCTADGVPEYGIAMDESQKTDANVTWQYIVGNTAFYLEDGDHGFIRSLDDDTRNFDEPKDYYRPIPLNETVLNPNLKQPPGW